MIDPQRVVNHFGSVRATARFFNVRPSAVYQWLEKKRFPRERELELNLWRPETFPAQIRAIDTVQRTEA
jgi:hypothetical protein